MSTLYKRATAPQARMRRNMLAQNFRTAADLGIEDAELEALIKVLGMLEREEIPAEQFTMLWVGEPECGTAGCILGHVRTVSIESYKGLSGNSWGGSSLERLFFPDAPKGGCDPYLATRSQAATALRSYLTTGEAELGGSPRDSLTTPKLGTEP